MNVSSRTERAADPAPPQPRRSRDHPLTAAARSRAATRSRLLESGLELFADRGLHGVTTHDIARHAGLAAGTFYLHFSNKRALFSELAHGATAGLRQRLPAAMRDAGADLEQAVRAHANALLSFAEANRPLIRILFSADADAAAVGADVLNELAAALSVARTEKGQVPPGCDSTVLSQAVVGMFARVLAWWVDDPDRVPRESVVETLVRIQLTGTRPR